MLKSLHRSSQLIYPAAHAVLSRLHPNALWHGDSKRHEVALTFDDGPSERDTPRLLEVLAKHGIKATFFALGCKVEDCPTALVRTLSAEGHQVALHGYHHIGFPLRRSADLNHDLARSRERILDICGLLPAQVRDVRPPYGTYTPAVLKRLWNWGYRPVMWSVVPLHWLQPLDETIRSVTAAAVPGSLIVLHEDATGVPVALIADRVIGVLKDRGFEFITVEQMWERR